MRNTLNYKAIINGQEVVVTRHQPSNGKGLVQRLDDAGNPKRRKVKNEPVDAQLHALDMLLASVKEHDEKDMIVEIENSIAKRVGELTGDK